MARYKLAIFDFDGTLADTFQWFTGVLNEVADRFDFRRVDDELLEELRGVDTRSILKRLELPLWKLPKIAAHMRELGAEQIDQIRLFNGARPMLHRLHEAEVQVAIVSSNSAETIRNVLGPETSAVVSQFECGASLFGKATKLKKVLRRAGVAPGDTLHVGDELRDAEASRAVGMPFGAVSWGYAKAEALAACDPDVLLHSFDELLREVLGFTESTP